MLQGIWAVVLVIMGSIGALVNGVVFADWIFFGLGAASMFVFRRGDAGDRGDGGMNPVRVFRTPGYPFVPIFFVIAAIVAVGSAVTTYPRESLLGMAMLGVGSVFYFVRKRI